ncbi:MAG: hypothetical protein M1829_004232 [Trizodia sp. TS-e1964]|nr:MAG: hypothetical protein M1829_004232 [Trizodia sp. TS-e1964]
MSLSAPDLPSITPAQVWATLWTLTGLATISVSARLTIRIIKFHRLYADDYFCIAGLIMLISLASMSELTVPLLVLFDSITAGVKFPPPDFFEKGTLYFRLQFAFAILFWSSLYSLKASFLALFYRISAADRLHNKVQLILWRIVVASCVISYIGSVITFPIYCHTFEIRESTESTESLLCQDSETVARALISLRFSTAVDIITDVMIIGLPIHLLWKANIIGRRKKAALMALFSAGIFIVVISVIRISVTNREEIIHEANWLGLWSIIETAVATIICCLASFRSLFINKISNIPPHGPIDRSPPPQPSLSTWESSVDSYPLPSPLRKMPLHEPSIPVIVEEPPPLPSPRSIRYARNTRDANITYPRVTQIRPLGPLLHPLRPRPRSRPRTVDPAQIPLPPSPPAPPTPPPPPMGVIPNIVEGNWPIPAASLPPVKRWTL